MGLQAYDGRDVRIQQASRSYADVIQLPGAAVRQGGTRAHHLQDEPYTVHQVSRNTTDTDPTYRVETTRREL